MSENEQRNTEKKHKSRSRNQNRSHYRKRQYFHKKSCYFCNNTEMDIDYKNVNLMKKNISDSYKIKPRRFTGTCAKHQRHLANEIKKARIMALIPFTEK